MFLHDKTLMVLVLFQKITQLEEEIDLKAQEVEFMKSQIETLTAHSGDESWVTNPGALQRQLIKQQQSMKVGPHRVRSWLRVQGHY